MNKAIVIPLISFLAATLSSADQQVLGHCKPGAMIELAGSCANGWASANYQTWGESKEVTPQRIKRSDAAQVKVVQVRLDLRKVSIEHPSAGRVWISADALKCDERNLSTYVLPPETRAEDGGCPGGGELPIDVNKLAAGVQDSLSEERDALVAKAHEYARAVQAKVYSDSWALACAYRDCQSPEHSAPLLKTVPERHAMLMHAAARVEAMYDRAKKIFGENCDQTGLLPKIAPEITRERGERTCRTFRDAYRLLEKALREPTQRQAVDRFDAEVTMSTISRKPNNDQLSSRVALFYGLDLDAKDPAPEKKALASKIQLVREDGDFRELEQVLGRPAGESFAEPHNGYLYGAVGQPGDPIECAGFALHYVLGMARVADPNGGKGAIPTVWDFENIHRSISGEAGVPPYFASYASCFSVVDLRKDQRPVRGDFVSSHGHVVMVNDYDPETRNIQTIEAASGEHGSVGLGTRPLFEPACEGNEPKKSKDWRLRPLRSDIRVLRYDPKPGCPILASRKQAKKR